MNGYPPPPGTMPGVVPTRDALRPLEGYVVRNQPNNIGFEAKISPPTTGLVDPDTGLLATDWVTVVDARPDCIHPELLGVVLGLTPLGPFPTTDEETAVHSMVRGKIAWGVGSAAYEAEFDWLRGTQLSVVAERAKVSARYMRYSFPWDDPPEDIIIPEFQLRAGLGYANAGRNSNPARLTEYVQLEAANDFVDVPIPPFAVSFTVITHLGASCSVTQLGYNGIGALYTVTGARSNTGQYNVENSFPIFNGATRLRVVNTNNPTAACLAFVIFGLAI